jgi:hypothetical protein
MGELEDTSASTGETAVRARHTPRLSILHLMLWMLCSAVYLTLIRAVLFLQEPPDNFAAIQRTTSVFQGVITGGVLTGAMVLGHARYRFGPPLLWHPGHWLLLVDAALTVVWWPLFFISAALERLFFEDGALLLFSGAVYLAQAIAYFIAIGHNKPFRWRILFGAMALLWLLRGLVFVGFSSGHQPLVDWSMRLWAIPTWGHFFVAAWTVFVSAWDLMAGQRRDWLHWTGVATYLGGRGVAAVWMAGAWLSQQ